MNTPTRIDALWLETAGVKVVFDLLDCDGETAHVVGGAVRNQLIGTAVTDIDFSTTALPQEVIARAEAAGIKAVPTGIEHGTVTLVIDGVGYEVTTLRADVETDGRRAVVGFTRDHAIDAARRDFTINALYCDRHGDVLDPHGGLADIGPPIVIRFIGEPEDRISEDYLRILRFFRFFAWYGDGRPDAAGLKACVRLKDGLNDLSAERIWQEMAKLLAAPDPSRALLWMRQTGVLTLILPESEKWGIDEIHGLIDAEAAFGWEPDAVLRLMAIVPPNTDRMTELAKRWKLPNLVRDRLLAWANTADIAPAMDDGALRARLYRKGQQRIVDTMRLQVARLRARRSDTMEDMAALARLIALEETAVAWSKPELPVSGKDLLALGFEAGPDLGRRLAEIEQKWIDSDFSLPRDDLLSMIPAEGAVER